VTRQDSYLEWDRSQWAGGSATRSPAQAEPPRWNKFQWVADPGRTRTSAWGRAQDMPEGEAGPSGFRHNPGTQHWAQRGAA
jgi:hypothetical protein